MPRIRTIKPEFFGSCTIAKLSHRARLTFIGLWVYADDEGRGRDDPRLIKATVWPQDDDVTIADVAADVTELNVAGLVDRYEKHGLKLIVVHSWREHQRINRKTKSKLPSPPRQTRKLTEPSLFTPAVVPQEVGSGSGSGKGKGSGSGTGKGSPRGNPKVNGSVHAHESKPNTSAKEDQATAADEETKALIHKFFDRETRGAS